MQEQLKQFLSNRKNLTNLLFLAILTLALPVGINLAKNRQIFFSSADRGTPIEVADGSCVQIRNGTKVLTCKDVPLKLISPLGGPPSPIPSISPSPAPSASPHGCFHDSDCLSGQTCNLFHNECVPAASPAGHDTSSDTCNPNHPETCSSPAPAASNPDTSNTVSCRNNPPGANAGSDFIWKAFCDQSCTPNGQFAQGGLPLSNDCPNSDLGPRTGICYTFTEGRRCVQFQSTN